MNFSEKYGNCEIKFQVKYRHRKTLAIQITPAGNITVLSPLGLTADEIKSKVGTKAGWITKKLLQFENLSNIQEKRKLADGKALMYLGSYCPVILNYNHEMKWLKVKFSDNTFIIDTPTRNPELLKKLLEKWYRKDAEKIIMQRIEKYMDRYKVKPDRIKVKEQKKRWGTCTSKGNLYFNWRIIMAPLHVIDYVIVHELSHLVHQNHSPLFWKHVCSVMPDYKKSKKWLKDNGLLLDL